MEPSRTVMVREESSNAEWNHVLVVASDALAHLDVGRLQDMSLSCAALAGKDHASPFTPHGVTEPVRREVSRQMAIFARILEITRANLNVMYRLRGMCSEKLEYGQERGLCGTSVEIDDGDH